MRYVGADLSKAARRDLCERRNLWQMAHGHNIIMSLTQLGCIAGAIL